VHFHAKRIGLEKGDKEKKPGSVLEF